MAHPDRDVYVGEVIDGRWEVSAFLDDGHFSNVYEGLDLATGNRCAVKILAMTHQSNADATVEFQTECELLELLEHRSHVVDRLAHGTHQMTAQIGNSSIQLNVPYLVLEVADGSLEELVLRRHQINWEDKLGLFRDVAKGLHQMQLERVANRDLKTGNVLVFADGRETIAKVSDLGRARSLKTATRFSPLAYEYGRGDGRFAPPELLWGLGSAEEEFLRLADLYLLGSVLFELATGQGITGMAVGDPTSIMQGTAGLPAGARDQSFKNHESDLQSRYQIAHELFEREVPASIRQVGGSLLRTLTSVDPSQREPRYVSRRRGQERWDLQWVLGRVDIMIRILRIHDRQRSRRAT